VQDVSSRATRWVLEAGRGSFLMREVNQAGAQCVQGEGGGAGYVVRYLNVHTHLAAGMPHQCTGVASSLPHPACGGAPGVTGQVCIAPSTLPRPVLCSS
jgi:hypothetical protein